jgi:hypothetical protein
MNPTQWVKVKLSLYAPWRHIEGVEVQLHSFVTSALDRDEWSVSHHGRFTPVKRPWYPVKRRLGKPQSWSGHFTGDKYFASAWIQTTNCPAHSLVTILVILSHLSRFYIFTLDWLEWSSSQATDSQLYSITSTICHIYTFCLLMIGCWYAQNM